MQQLSDFVQEWSDRPLIYGVWDCAHMVSDWIARTSGENPMQDWPKYSTIREARATLKEQGFKTLNEAVTAKLTPLDSILNARKGDIVAIKSQFKSIPALAIRLNANTAFAFRDDIQEGEVIANTPAARIIDLQFATGEAWQCLK